ncbi:MAG TPA: response regulator [Coleofasciculaceae cyanobacterium]
MKRILIIEDEAIIRLGLIRLLQGHQFEAIGASNANQGIQLALDNRPNLIICNIHIPDRNGYQILDELRNNQNTAKIPFLFLTAQTLEPDLLVNSRMELMAYLTKPYNTEELLQVITQLIGCSE